MNLSISSNQQNIQQLQIGSNNRSDVGNSGNNIIDSTSNQIQTSPIGLISSGPGTLIDNYNNNTNSQIYNSTDQLHQQQIDLTDINNINNLQNLLDSKISDNSKQRISDILNEIATLSAQEKLLLYLRLPGSKNDSDPLRQPQNPLGTRAEINHTINWVRSHLEHDPKVSIPKQDVYNDYMTYCERLEIKPLSTADFGKVMKQVFPEIKPRRLGTRGHSRYCYAAMRKATKLISPKLPILNSNNAFLEEISNENWEIIKNWSENILNSSFDTVNDLTSYIMKQNLNKQTNSISVISNDVPSDVKNKRKYSQKVKTINPLKKKRNKKRKDSTSSDSSSKPLNSTAIKKVETIDMNYGQTKADLCQPINLTSTNKPQPFIFQPPSNTIVPQNPNRGHQYSLPIECDYDIKKEVVDSSYNISTNSQSYINNNETNSKTINKDIKYETDKTSEDMDKETEPKKIKTSSYVQDANVLSKNKAQLRAKRISLMMHKENASDDIEKIDDIPESLGLPRERVISICNMDKHELDDYLNGENSLEDQDAELLQYFQNDDRKLTLTDETDHMKLNQMSKFNDRRNSFAKKEHLANLRNYLQQNLNTNGSLDSVNNTNDASVYNKINPAPSASASLAYMSKRQNTIENNRQILSRRKISINASAGNSKNFNFVPISIHNTNNNNNHDNNNNNNNGNNFLSPTPKQRIFRPSIPNRGYNYDEWNGIECTASAPPSPSQCQQRYMNMNGTINNNYSNVNCGDKMFNFDTDTSNPVINPNDPNLNFVGGENFEYNRSQSVPLQTKIYPGYLSEYNSVNQTPVPSEFNDFNEPFLDILTTDNKNSQIKLESSEPYGVVSTVNTPTVTTSDLIAHNKAYLMDTNNPNLSRSNPVTPIPSMYNTLNFNNNNNNKINRQKYDESKSVPTTPLDIGSPFTYSPIETSNRDCLINGNPIENISDTYYGPDTIGIDGTSKKMPLKKVPFLNNDLTNLNNYNTDPTDVLESL